MKNLIFLGVLFLAATGRADSQRVINSGDLECAGKMLDKRTIALSIAVESEVTKLTIKERKHIRQIFINEDFIVTSEGVVYIQLVSNELGYNLYLSGDDLWDVLNKRDTKQVDLTGKLNFFDEGWQLKCTGTLSSGDLY